MLIQYLLDSTYICLEYTNTVNHSKLARTNITVLRQFSTEKDIQNEKWWLVKFFLMSTVDGRQNFRMIWLTYAEIRSLSRFERPVLDNKYTFLQLKFSINAHGNWYIYDPSYSWEPRLWETNVQGSYTWESKQWHPAGATMLETMSPLASKSHWIKPWWDHYLSFQNSIVNWWDH